MHITTSSTLGVAYGGAAFALFDVPLPTCLLAGGLCGVSGMLPDLDSDSGIPLRESVAFAAAVVPMMLIDRLMHPPFNFASEMLVLSGAVAYLVIRFGLAKMLSRFTVHRGMFHSLPAAAIAGELAFLVASGDLDMRCFKAGGVLLGFMSHLILDEIYSLDLRHGRVKKSFGTAVKLWSKSHWANVSTYAKLALLSAVVFNDPVWSNHDNVNLRDAHEVASEAVEGVQDVTTNVIDHIRR